MISVDGYRREKPLRCGDRLVGVCAAPRSLVLSVGTDVFRDNHGDNHGFVNGDVVYT
jgi:hypothetical protein